MMLLVTIKFWGVKRYEELKDLVVNGRSRNIKNYLTDKAHIFDFSSLLKKEKD
jgi:hypothetical protein